jgi:hypothetical protein
MVPAMALGESGGAVGALLVGGVFVVLFAVVGVMMQRGLGPTTTPASAPPSSTVVAPTPFATKDTPKVETGGFTFTDPGDSDLYLSTLKRIGVVRASLGDLKTTSTDAALDDVTARCAALAPDLTTLGREPHPGVREYVAKAKKTCEYDVPVALLKISVDRAKAAKKGASHAPSPDCARGGKLADDLKLHHYEDDPDAHPLLAAFAAACTT